MAVDPAPAVEAQMVFVGYGPTIPELHYDDLAGLDLHGKIAVISAFSSFKMRVNHRYLCQPRGCNLLPGATFTAGHRSGWSKIATRELPTLQASLGGALGSAEIWQHGVHLEAAHHTQSTQPMAHGPEDLTPDSHFVSEHLQRTFRQIYRIVRNVADAQDLTQEAFIKALRHRDQLKEERKAAHWLSRIATNAAIDFVRRNRSAAFVEFQDEHQRHDDNPERTLLSSETCAYLDAGLRRLTPRERAAILLRDVEGLPAEQVARLLDCSKTTVRSHIAHARIKLRAHLDRNQR